MEQHGARVASIIILQENRQRGAGAVKGIG